MVAAAPPAAETSDGPPVLSPATTPTQSLALSAGIEADLIDEVEIIPLPSAEGEGPTAATPTGGADGPITDVDAAGFADATPAPAKRKLMASADDSLPPARIKPRHSAPAQLASLEKSLTEVRSEGPGQGRNHGPGHMIRALARSAPHPTQETP